MNLPRVGVGIAKSNGIECKMPALQVVHAKAKPGALHKKHTHQVLQIQFHRRYHNQDFMKVVHHPEMKDWMGGTSECLTRGTSSLLEG